MAKQSRAVEVVAAGLSNFDGANRTATVSMYSVAIVAALNPFEHAVTAAVFELAAERVVVVADEPRFTFSG